MSKRRDLTAAGKLEILQSYDRLPSMSKRRAAGKLNISHSTLANIIRGRSTIELAALENENLNRKRKRSGKDKNVERALKEWFLEARENDFQINGRILMKKAEEIAVSMGVRDFKATDGWFCRWKKRENISLKNIGKQGDGIQEGANSWLRTTWLELLTYYSPEDVYIADEIILHFNSLPERPARNDEEAEEKTNDEQLTVLCCASMLGEKKQLLVVGKSELSHTDGDRTLPVDYAASDDGTLTSDIFNERLHHWDKRLSREILLLTDDRPSHKLTDTFRYIKIVFLPPSTTSLVQPCDHGVIRVIKAHYQRELGKIFLAVTDQGIKTGISPRTDSADGSIGLLDALHKVHNAWCNVSDQTLSKCFRVNSSEPHDGTIVENSTEPAKEPFVKMEIDCDPSVTEEVTSSMIEHGESNTGINSNVGSLSPPTSQEMLDALQVLRNGILHRTRDHEQLEVFEEYVKKVLDEDNKGAVTLHPDLTFPHLTTVPERTHPAYVDGSGDTATGPRLTSSSARFTPSGVREVPLAGTASRRPSTHLKLLEPLNACPSSHRSSFFDK